MIKVLLYELYKDSVWRQAADKNPILNKQIALIPQYAEPSQLVEGWSVYMMTDDIDEHLPPMGHLGVFMQFGNEDAGPEYNISADVAYKSVKHGKPFQHNPSDAVITREDLKHDEREKYDTLEKHIIWQVGSAKNKFIIEYFADLTDARDSRKNFETCELVLYKVTKFYVHVSPDTQVKIQKLFDSGVRGVPIPKELMDPNQETAPN
jgi:hypothetical protein